jgi:large subunit ribosomal protein L9
MGLALVQNGLPKRLAFDTILSCLLQFERGLNMKVLLKEDVDNLGYAGEIMTVADGYGRNYLIPRGLAVKASPGVLRAAEKWREQQATRKAELQKEYNALSERLVETQLTFVARAGETGKLYGSVTTADVVDKLNEELGTEIERRQIVGGALRQLGDHQVTIRLSRDFQPQITVTIEQFEEGEIAEEELAEETAEAEVAAEAEEMAEAEVAVEEEAAEIEAEEMEEAEADAVEAWTEEEEEDEEAASEAVESE